MSLVSNVSHIQGGTNRGDISVRLSFPSVTIVRCPQGGTLQGASSVSRSLPRVYSLMLPSSVVGLPLPFFRCSPLKWGTCMLDCLLWFLFRSYQGWTSHDLLSSLQSSVFSAVSFVCPCGFNFVVSRFFFVLGFLVFLMLSPFRLPIFFLSAIKDICLDSSIDKSATTPLRQGGAPLHSLF